MTHKWDCTTVYCGAQQPQTALYLVKALPLVNILARVDLCLEIVFVYELVTITRVTCT